MKHDLLASTSSLVVVALSFVPFSLASRSSAASFRPTAPAVLIDLFPCDILPTLFIPSLISHQPRPQLLPVAPSLIHMSPYD
jgi:Cu/Ag efflux pump CusA